MSNQEHGQRTSDNESESRRSAQDDILVAALAAGQSYRQAGNQAGLDKRTVARRMKEPQFIKRVRDRRREYVDAVDGQLAMRGRNAVEAISECLDDPDPRVRLAAARLILSVGIKSRNQNELERELMEIRAILAEGS